MLVGNGGLEGNSRWGISASAEVELDIEICRSLRWVTRLAIMLLVLSSKAC